MRSMLLLLLVVINIILYGLVRKFVRPFCFFLIISLFSLVLNYTNELLGTQCASLIEDLFLFCYERDFMLSLSHKN